MGGVLILIAVFVSTLLWADFTNQHIWIVLISTAGFGLIGFIDDYLVAKKGKRTKRKLDGFIKKQILRIRDENRDCCG